MSLLGTSEAVTKNTSDVSLEHILVHHQCSQFREKSGKMASVPFRFYLCERAYDTILVVASSLTQPQLICPGLCKPASELRRVCVCGMIFAVCSPFPPPSRHYQVGHAKHIMAVQPLLFISIAMILFFSSRQCYSLASSFVAGFN